MNFFAHTPTVPDPAREAAWRNKLAPYYREMQLDPAMPIPAAARAPFDAAMCEVVETLKPEIVSFHFGLPEESLLKRVKAAGCVVIASATIVKEAVWLEERGVDAIIAQGAEAGGHRSMFLTDSIETQPGTFALIPQMADAVRVPVIAAGGIADARQLAAVIALGAGAAQIGTAFLPCPESGIGPVYRDALRRARADGTALTRSFSGRPARAIRNRAIDELEGVLPYPAQLSLMAPLRGAEGGPAGAFEPMWSGQSAALARELPAADVVRALAQDADRLVVRLAAAAG
jgi:nitronate monooxygenase